LYLAGPRLRLLWGSLLIAFHVNVFLLTGIPYLEAALLLALFTFPWAALAVRRGEEGPPPFSRGAATVLKRAALLVAILAGSAWLLPIRAYTALGTSTPAGAAASAPPTAGPRRVIPPGNERVALEMLSGHLPKDCEFGGASISTTFVVARYRCAGREVNIELHDVSEAQGALEKTREFALLASPAPAPPDLVQAVKANVLAREANWRWTLMGPAGTPSSGSITGTLALAIGGLTVTAVAGWLVARAARRSAATKS
jgi:hypothetical protein